MKLEKSKFTNGTGVRFSLTQEDGTEVGRAYLYILYNDLHAEPFGFMEDVYIHEEFQGQGYGTQIINALVEEARVRGCYKLIGTSREERPRVHALYEKLGFTKYGREFRMNF